MMLSEKIIDLLVCFVAFVVFAIVVSIYPEEKSLQNSMSTTHLQSIVSVMPNGCVTEASGECIDRIR